MKISACRRWMALFAITLAGTGCDTGLPLGDIVPTARDLLVDGPGFSVVIPKEFALTENSSSQPGVQFWRRFSDALGLSNIYIGVYKPTIGNSTNLEDVAIRIKGAQETSAGDFILLAGVGTIGLLTEADAAEALLADGNILVAWLVTPDLGATQELVANQIFASIDLKNTDGRDFEKRLMAESPTLDAKGTNGFMVLSDSTTWNAFSVASVDQLKEIARWKVGDHIISQTVKFGGADERQLVQVGNWVPVPVENYANASRTVIQGAEGEFIELSDGSTWVVGVDNASRWNIGQTLFRLEDPTARLLLHAPSGQSVVNPIQGVTGPGFTLRLPSGVLLEDTQTAPPAGVLFWRAYFDAIQGTGYAVGVNPPAISGGGGSAASGFAVRIRGSIITEDSDLLLIARLSTGDLFGQLEADVGLAQLADGNFLYLYTFAPKITSIQELLAGNMYRSVHLTGTDGKSLESLTAGETPALRVRGSNGMLILGDLSVWELPLGASASDNQEIAAWTAGSHVYHQTYRKPFFSTDTDELLHVGRWKPVEVKYDGQASAVTVTQILNSTTLRLSDGIAYNFGTPLPAGWVVGDSIFTIEVFGETTLIHEKSGRAEGGFS